ncbi:MAG: hypothetical protein WD689_05500 [Gaiellaceae bacterium]
MRRVANFVLVGAVAAVAVAAAVDSLRDDPKPVPAEVRGELIYSDADCRRHGIRLPGLARRDFLTLGCAVFSRADNLGVRDGEVSWFAYPVPGGSTTLLRRYEVPEERRVIEVAWLQGRRFAAVLSPGELLTVWEGNLQVLGLGRGAFDGLRASTRGRYFAVRDHGALRVFDREGRELDLPAGHAIAWSPAERYAAIATGDEVLIVPAEGGEPLARLSVRARDLDWRREP